MRLLLLIALIFFIVAFICAVAPATLVFAYPGWALLGFIFWVLDLLAGGWAVPVGIRRVP